MPFAMTMANGDAVRHGHEVAGKQPGVGLRWQIAFVDGPLEAVAQA